ncbi:MAG: hypothetical protein ACN6I3_00095 [bacterium]
MAKPLRIIILSVVTTCLAAVMPADERKTILFYGDSLTAGYGLDDPTVSAFPAVIQGKIDAAGLPYRVINAGLSGETSAGESAASTGYCASPLMYSCWSSGPMTASADCHWMC